MTLWSQPSVLAIASSYFLLVLAVGFWSARRTKSPRDFWIAGQRIGLWVTGLATTSAAFSGFVFIGGPGLMYQMGLGSMFIVVPVSITAGLLCWVVAKRLRLLAEAREVFTIPDAILCRYRSRLASGLAALAVVVGTVAYLGSQFLALGRLFGSDSPTAMAAGLAVLLVYSVLGGMVAGVYTDVLQGGLMALVAILVFFQALAVGGGLGQITRSISDAPEFGPAFLEPLGSAPVFTALGLYFVFAIGSLGQPHMLHKFYMLADATKLKWMPLVIGGSQALCLLIWLGIGLAVPALVAEGRLAALAHPDDAAPAFLLSFSPPLLAGLALAGIVAAIMSTADSFLNIGSAALVRDLPKAFGAPVTHELFWGRIAVVAIALAASGLALATSDLIALVGTFAFGTFAAALAPALAIGLNWRRVTATAAVASMATGIVANVLLEIASRWFPLPFAPGVVPAAVATAASFTVLLVLSFLLGSAEGDALDDDVAAVMDA